jgi:hypothetical protein
MNPGILLKELLETDKTAAVTALLVEFIAANQESCSWRPVGDRPNNSGTIQAAGDPMRALVERITNAIDAVIDRAHHDHAGKPQCNNPRDAAQAWFGVPKAGLHKLSESERRKLAQDTATVLLLEGDGKARRCVDISDKGMGLTPSQMPKTILSLNESNKLDKFYLAGAFGQGGSATLASAEFTLVASRSVDSPETIGFTIVKYEPPKGVKLGSYVYLVSSGEVLQTKDIPLAFGDASTRVRHYGYDLDDYGSKLGPSSVYGRCQTILFDPVLPFWFRTNVHDFGRTIKGVRAALNGARDADDDESKLSHSVPLFYSDLGEFGQIGIEYWVLEASEKSAAPNRAYVNSAKPIVVSINGQLHAEWSAVLLRKDADLLHIAPRMVVHIDCNKLSLDAKNALFVSNREESRKGQLQNMILTELLNALRSDERLVELNDEAKNAGLKQRDEAAEKEIRREVARMLKLFGFSVAEELAASKKKEGKEKAAHTAQAGRRSKIEPILPKDPPTFVEMVGPAPVTLYPGQRKFIRIRTDALSTYHEASDPTKSRFKFIVDGSKVRFVGSTELRDGHMRAIFASDPESLVGNSGKLMVELRPPASPTLSSELPFVIVLQPTPKAASANVNLPQIDIQPIDAIEDPEWTKWNWPADAADVAADYIFAGDTLTIRYSTIFPRFSATLGQMTAKGAAIANSFVRRYEIWLTTSVLIHWQDSGSDTTSVAQSGLEQDKVDDFRRDEIRRMAKAAVVYAQREVLQGSTPTLADEGDA